MNERIKIVKSYLSKLKKDEILLLKSSDTYFKNHYSGSPLNILTNFSGSEGEAILDYNGKITIFVDSRYHILVEKQVFSDVEIFKIPFGESFESALEKKYKKNTILHVPNDILLKKYLNFEKHFDLRTYKIEKSSFKNKDLNLKSPIFLVDEQVEKIPFEKKVEKIKKNFPNVSKMLIFNLDNISYLTNLRSFQMKYSSNFKSILYLDLKNNKNILFCDEINKNILIKNLIYKKISEFSGIIGAIETDIYCDIDDIALKDYLLLKSVKPLKNKNLNLLASIKTKSNIDDLKNCYHKKDVALLNFKNKLKQGLSEYELSEIFEKEILKQGATGLSFKTILAINENSASIHYSNPSKEVKLKDESLILLDCGGYFNSGFATDITRVFYYGANPDPFYKKIYTYVLKAFFACFNSKENNAKKLDNLSREILKPLEKHGFLFEHGLGHGIGTSVHQNPPVLSMFSKDIIKPFQVHSIEPGLYGKNSETGLEFGIRLENCVYSDLNYNKISLSNFPFEECLIDYNLLNQNEKDMLLNWQGKFNENN